MEQFSLDKWLENPSRKVVTRSGHNVRILCTDQRGNMPIVALVEFETLDGVQMFYSDGKNESHREYDLFFADEGEELTEFEKKLQIIISEASHWISDDGSVSTYCQFGDKEIKKISGQILDLARKKLEKDIYDNGYRLGYGIGKEDVLKDLPKWKKMPNGVQGNGDFNPTYLVRVSNGYYFTAPCISWDKDSMYVELSELEKLPKEE